ncbi:MAG: phenylalanine--tRNA ligase beta subunit-related protein [Negativicutes bacterium]|nr:phenylalanine--tRNA ligase beta subunit-related protein [Negativicutes bacterium]MDR3592856.1 phenylalanine--tRNA ligase beta subunit-related protein [Negativicutes bacterium]
MIIIEEAFRSAFPGANLGVLAMGGVVNPATHPGLEGRKTELENGLRARFAGADRASLKQLAAVKAYDAYYRNFDKSYHVLLQLESVALKGKVIPSVAALVEAMFMAELKNMLLTAGHDLDKVAGPLTLGVSAGGETYQGIRGRQETMKAGDMMISDTGGIISSVLYGPDARTSIASDTSRVMFTVYAPAGVGAAAVAAHLGDIEGYVRLVAPAALTLTSAVL